RLVAVDRAVQGRLVTAVARERLPVHRAVQGGPVGAAVGRHLGVEVVVVGLDLVPAVEGQLRRRLAGEVHRTRQGVLEVVTAAAPPLGLALGGGDDLGGDGLLRQFDDQALLVLGVVLGQAQLVPGVDTRLGPVVVQPAQLELVPGGHVAGQVTDLLLAGAQPGTGGHQGPETGGVLAAGGVVEVRQAEVVTVLVGEDAESAVLRLDGVVADPDAGLADGRAAQLVLLRTGGTGVGAERVPAVRPDGVRALGAAARGLVLAGVHDLEVVDVAVGLVEVAVAVEVVAVPLVELGDVRLDLGVGLAGRLLLGDPGVQAVADDVPHARAVALAAGVVAVTGLVVRDLDPVGDLALDGVAAGGLPLEVRLDRLGVLALAEVQVLEVLPVVVRLPGGGVVLLAVRLGDLVVQRAGRAAVAAVDLVAELDEDREDLVGLLAAELDVHGVALLALEADD